MKRLLIVGAGGFGRELLGYAEEIPTSAREWNVGGFLDANPHALDGFSVPYAILGDPATFEPADEDLVICALGEPKIKLKICRLLKSRGARFATLIHPTALVRQSNVIGEGLIACPYTNITSQVRIGEFVTVNTFSGVGHNSTIGPGCTLSAHVDVTGGVVLGEGVFLGSHACVLPGVTVGEYAIVGAGSVVIRNVKAHTTVFGAPARAIMWL